MAGASLIAAVMVVTMTLAPSVRATSYVVGGQAYGWSEVWHRSPTALQKWATGMAPYHPTDELVFQYKDGEVVLWVAYNDFAPCNLTNPLGVYVPPNGSSVDTLTFPLTNYSISTLYFVGGVPGTCDAGQKFYIDVLP